MRNVGNLECAFTTKMCCVFLRKYVIVLKLRLDLSETVALLRLFLTVQAPGRSMPRAGFITRWMASPCYHGYHGVTPGHARTPGRGGPAGWPPYIDTFTRRALQAPSSSQPVVTAPPRPARGPGDWQHAETGGGWAPVGAVSHPNGLSQRAPLGAAQRSSILSSPPFFGFLGTLLCLALPWLATARQ